MTAVLFQRSMDCESWSREIKMPELDLRGGEPVDCDASE